MRQSTLFKFSLIAVLPVLAVVAFAPSTFAQLTLEWSLDLTHLQDQFGQTTIARECMAMDSEGNVYIAYRDYGIGVIKIRPDKSIAFQTVYPAAERPYVLLVGPSGECYVLAGEEINGNYDHFRVFRFESTGVASWSYSWGNPRASFVNTWGMDFSGDMWVATADFVYDAPCLDSTIQTVLMKGTPTGMTVVNTFRGPYMNGGAYPNTINPIVADRQGYVRFLLSEGAKCYTEDCDEYPPACYVDQYGESTVNWSRLKVRTHTSGGGLSSETVLYTSSDPSQHEDRVWSIAGNKDGDLITIYTYRPDSAAWVWETSVKHKSWTTVLPNRPIGWGPTADYNGDIYITTETVSDGLTVSTMYKLSGTNGAVLWSHPWWEHHLGVDRENNFYTSDGKVDPDGNLLWNWPNLGSAGSIGSLIGIDDQHNHFHFDGNTKILYKFVEDLTLTLEDALGDPMTNKEFELTKITNNPPMFTEEAIGTITTDIDGTIQFNAGTDSDWEITVDGMTVPFDNGDLIKFSKNLGSVPAVKHQDVLATMYSVHLDNAQFDATGAMSFYEVGGNEEPTIIMNHTEIRYNLLVSVEWDAERPFLWGLEANIRAMSNYLYDITDGQARLDTVVILDDHREWDRADVQVHASNVIGSYTQWQGIYEGLNPVHIVVPRRDYGDAIDNRDSSHFYHPLNGVSIETFRVLTHELGHYALGFYDEYMFCCAADGSYHKAPWSALKCDDVDLYGYMHWLRPDRGARTSEMSSATAYSVAECRNTKQYRELGMSCWDYFEARMEGYYWVGGSSIYAPVIKPDDPERDLATGFDYLPGPNDNTGFLPGMLDYDVGARINFTQPVEPPAPLVKSLHVLVEDVPPGGAKVRLLKPVPGGFKGIDQGLTTDLGLIWVMGAHENDDHVWAGIHRVTITPPPGAALSSVAGDTWVYGEFTVTGSDSVHLVPFEVDGDYPLICEATLGDGTLTYSLTATTPFSDLPSLSLQSSYGAYSAPALASVTGGYEATVSDSLGYEGSFTVAAIDASARNFSFWTDYVHKIFDTTDLMILGPRRMSLVEFDEADSAIERALLLTSPYPIIRSGLEPNAIQAGEAQSISVYPAAAMTADAALTIGYDDAALSLGAGLAAVESSLQIYQWDSSLQEWILLGGNVDTVQNEVWSLIPQTGVYAAFTTQLVTDADDYGFGDNLPYRFNLFQNYPNPFNPATTIEYSLSERAHVTIEVLNILGQRVRALVDREESAGSYTIGWDGSDDGGNQVATGVYLYRFQAGEHIQTKKMLLLK